MCIYYVTGTVLDTVDTTLNTLDKNSYLHGAYNLVRKKLFTKMK